MADQTVTSLTGSPEVRLALVERDVEQYGQFFAKIDVTLEKLTSLLTSINQVLAVHESKINDYSIVEANLYKILDEHIKTTQTSLNSLTVNLNTNTGKQKDLTKQQKETHDTVCEYDDRIFALEQWKWIIIGGVGAAALFGNAISEKLFGLFSGIIH